MSSWEDRLAELAGQVGYPSIVLERHMTGLISLGLRAKKKTKNTDLTNWFSTLLTVVYDCFQN